MSTGEVTQSDFIHFLSEIEGIRYRPAMYIGGTDVHGLHEMVQSFLNFLFESHLKRELKEARMVATSTSIEIWMGGIEISRSDFDRYLEKAFPSRVVIDCDWSGYRDPRPIYSVMLSKVFIIQNMSASEQYQTVYRQGRRFDLNSVATPNIDDGLWIRFEIDSEIFGDSRLNLRELRKWLIEQLRTLPGLAIEFEDREARITETLAYSDGVQGYLNEMVLYHGLTNMAYPEVIRIYRLDGDFRIDFAFTHHHSMKRASMNNFINGDRCSEGGVHVDGLYEGMAEALSQFGEKEVTTEQVQTGIIGAISVVMKRTPKIESEGPTREKAKLFNTLFRDTGNFVSTMVREFISEKLQEYLRYEPDLGRAILRNVMARKS